MRLRVCLRVRATSHEKIEIQSRSSTLALAVTYHRTFEMKRNEREWNLLRFFRRATDLLVVFFCHEAIYSIVHLCNVYKMIQSRIAGQHCCC